MYPFGASAEGADDMIGNVFEWTSSEPSKGSGAYTWRGGSFSYGRRLARSSYRFVNQPFVQNRYLGFRVAGDVDQA